MKPRRQGQRGGFTLGLGLLVSGVCLYWVVQGVEWAEVLRTLGSTHLVPFLLAGVIGASSNVVRAVRWGLLLGYRPPDRVRELFSSTMIGYLGNNVLPARLGEVVRLYVLERTTEVPMSRGAATVVAERLLDSLVLLALLGAVAFFVPLPSAIAQGGRVLGGVVAAVTIVLVWTAWRGDRLLRRLDTGSSGGSSRIRQKLFESAGRFIEGLRIWRGGSHALSVLALTIGIWGLEVVAVGLVMRSLEMDLPALAAICVLVVVSLSFVIPAAPGAVGTYELFAVMALTPFAVDGSRALGLALLLHVLVLGTSTILGAACLWAESLSLRGLLVQAREQRVPEPS